MVVPSVDDIHDGVGMTDGVENDTTFECVLLMKKSIRITSANNICYWLIFTELKYKQRSVFRLTFEQLIES